MTDSEKRRRLQPTCNCEHWAAVARKNGSVTFICPVHGCATLDSRPVTASIPMADPVGTSVPVGPGWTDARSTRSLRTTSVPSRSLPIATTLLPHRK